MYKNALVSVSNKSGLVDFLKPLVAQGLRVVSTGGTARHLEENGIPVVQVSEQTGFPEMMDGRVRTLHPHIHMALLARAWVPEDQELLKQQKVEAFDLVVCNLYPFEQALIEEKLQGQELVEYIDVGGPSMLRAAAKNYSSVTVICDPLDYSWVSEKRKLTLEERKTLAAKVFAHTGAYDATIAQAMGVSDSAPLALGGQFLQKLRYGENPQQEAVWYRRTGSTLGLHQAQIIQGKELSYNNLLDLEAATRTVRDFQSEECVAVGVKHNNPCGIGIAAQADVAVARALKADPVSIFGGIFAVNTNVSASMALLLGDIFLECVIAPKISDEAREIFAKKKNLRILEWEGLLNQQVGFEVKTLSGGYLVQSADQVHTWTEDWTIIGQKPDEPLHRALALAWKACAHLKSNAIAIANDEGTLGMGMGQVNRVDAVDQAIGRWRQHHGENVKNVVLASDAFFPFADSIERIAKAGIRWVVQPGGSLRDQEVFDKAKELGVNLVLTHVRHFRH
jgi:phosphoribosylaminoimidazolecarboxamide formyltransferase/IMP cyclohydrolase